MIYDEDDRLVICNDAYRALYPENAYKMVPGERFEDTYAPALPPAKPPTPSGARRNGSWSACAYTVNRAARVSIG